MFHVSMMLMGFYGYVYDDTHHTVAGSRTTIDVLKNTAIWTDYTTAFLLQALEMKYGIATTHDWSACSCMKYFANQTTLILENNDKITDKHPDSRKQRQNHQQEIGRQDPGHVHNAELHGLRPRRQRRCAQWRLRAAENMKLWSQFQTPFSE